MRCNGHNLQKGELTRSKETFLPFEGGSVLEQVPGVIASLGQVQKLPNEFPEQTDL